MRLRLGRHSVIRVMTAGLMLFTMNTYAQEDLRNVQKQFRVVDGVLQEVTSSGAMKPIADSTFLNDSLVTVVLPVSDSTQTGSLRSEAIADITAKRKRTHYLRDSIPISRMTWISAALPGYGQLYNKQAWKIPIIYAVGGTSLAMTIKEHNSYKKYKNQYNTLVYEGASREILDRVQPKMIRHNTNKQLFMMAFIGTYIYSISDAALNYRWESPAIKKATTLSTILPGAGQFFNKSYWKVPIVLGGAATMAFVIDWNNRGYNRFKLAYDLRYTAQVNGTVSKDEFEGWLSIDNLREWKNNYRRNRDLCIIIAGGLYLLNIVEAHVDASLKDYDISDDLAMEIEPKILNYSMYAASGNAFGFGLNFRF